MIKFFKYFFIFTWIVMIGFLIKKHSLNKATNIPQKKEISSRKYFYGIYLKDKKVGYAISVIERKENGYTLTEDIFFELVTMGVPQKIKMFTKCETDTDFNLEKFNFYLNSFISSFKIEGEVKDKTLKGIIYLKDAKNPFSIPLKEKPNLWINLKKRISFKNMEIGKVYKASIFDPTSMNNVQIEIIPEAKETLNLEGEKISAIRLRLNYAGVEIKCWVDENGDSLIEESPWGVMLKREPIEKALSSVSSEIPDIISMFSIKVNKIIENPRKLKYLKIRLSGIDFKKFDLDGGRQKLNKDILTIYSESEKIPKEKINTLDFLKSTPFLQCDKKEVIDLANKIVEGEKEEIKKVEKILTWVYENLKKEPTVSIPNTLEILKERRGDCNEHATLFVALLRALKIPSRICAGLVYQDGSFYYHAWAEVFIKNKWIAIDPIENAFPADATHIRLIFGGLNKQAKILSLLNKLKIEVLEYSY